MTTNQFFIDSTRLSEAALQKKHQIEQDPSCRTDHMAYMEGMEQINSDVMTKVLDQMQHYDYDQYTAEDAADSGDEQFEISDDRSFDEMYSDIAAEGLQPVLNDYVYV